MIKLRQYSRGEYEVYVSGKYAGLYSDNSKEFYSTVLHRYATRILDFDQFKAMAILACYTLTKLTGRRL